MSATPRFWKDRNGTVHLQGRIDPLEAIFVLPEGYRPMSYTRRARFRRWLAGKRT